MMNEHWSVEESVRCVVAPCCAFTFDASHVDVRGGGYSCPLCQEAKMHRRVNELEHQVDDLSATVIKLTDQIARLLSAARAV